LTGNEVVIEAALASGATGYAGYPITPTTEIMTEWEQKATKNKQQLLFIQSEDEMAAGFMTCGMIIGGRKAFTATGGPGNVLMQDPLSMAESLRLPLVVIVGQRGGPSTGSVIYSQQELFLSAWGGNSEGYRIVYSASNLTDLYNCVIKAFNVAWTYRWPAIVLTDGYLLKTENEVDIMPPKKIVSSYPLMVKKTVRDTSNESEYVNWCNTYSTEEDLYVFNKTLHQDFAAMTKKIVEYEIYPQMRKTMIVAHGLIAASVKEALLNDQNCFLFRPITINPFPVQEFNKCAAAVDKIIVIESAYNQLIRVVKENLQVKDIPIVHWGKPGIGISAQEIWKIIK